MGINVHPIDLGFAQSYVIQSEEVILIDCGPPGRANDILKGIERLSIEPEEIRLIVLTHGHWDHIGSASAIKEITGADIALHQQEKDWLEKSLKSLPPGATAWGRILIGMMALFMPLVHIPAANVDIVLGDEGLSLAEYGVAGSVIHTPGHSSGSVSVLLETGDALVGDLAMNTPPLRFSPGFPIFAEDMQTVKGSWRQLLDEGAETVYPGHGKPFSADIIRNALL